MRLFTGERHELQRLKRLQSLCDVCIINKGGELGRASDDGFPHGAMQKEVAENLSRSRPVASPASLEKTWSVSSVRPTAQKQPFWFSTQNSSMPQESGARS